MSMSIYVPAEQMMKDKADFARKGIARGKALAALLYADGILICAENSSSSRVNPSTVMVATTG